MVKLLFFRPTEINKLISNERYLHFPPNIYCPNHDNDYIKWAINASSDYEDEDNDDENKINQNKDAINEWIKVKAKLAEIQISNNFGNF